MSPASRRGDRRPTFRGAARHRDRPTPLGEAALVAAAALALAAGAVVWLVGGLLVLATSGSWRDVAPSAVPGLLVRLALRPAQARAAWPKGVRGRLPSAGVVEATLAAALCLAAAAAAAAGAARARSAAGRRPPAATRRRPLAGAARRHRPVGNGSGWARPADLRPLVVAAPPGDRVVLGRAGRRLVAAEPGHSLLVVGPTQSGKTSGLAIPAIVEWAGPVLATSVKSDLVRDTVAARQRLGDVACYDPTACTGLPASGWSPLASAATWPGARKAAAALCGFARAGDRSLDDAGFWYASAEKLLAPMLLAAATIGATMSEVVAWLDDEEAHDVLLALELAGETDALRSARACAARDERQRSSIYATAETVVAAFADPVVAASARRADFAPASLLGEGAGAGGGVATLYCCAPSREQERLAPVFSALVREVLDAAFDRSAVTGRPLDPPLLVVLDEAANVAPLSDLDVVAATAAAHGIQLVTVFQDLAQVESRYGARWPTVVNNHRAKLACSGLADPMTLDYLGRVIGDERTTERSRTVGDDGRTTTTEAPAQRPVAPAGEIRRLEPGTALLVYGHLPPARLALRPRYDEPGHRSGKSR